MATLSPRQREVLERDAQILGVARELLLERGYYGVTMDRIASASDCPKGTMYQRFACKEDIVISLASQSLDARNAMLRRGAAFEGLSRERMLGMGEAMALYAGLSAADSRILHTAMGPIREKASAERVSALRQSEREGFLILRGVLEDAVANEELTLPEGASVEELGFGVWSLVEGCYTLMESDIPRNTFHTGAPINNLFRVFNVLCDGYGWRPFSTAWDWEETIARIRKCVFPEETQQLYGDEGWYGVRG